MELIIGHMGESRDQKILKKIIELISTEEIRVILIYLSHSLVCQLLYTARPYNSWCGNPRSYSDLCNIPQFGIQCSVILLRNETFLFQVMLKRRREEDYKHRSYKIKLQCHVFIDNPWVSWELFSINYFRPIFTFYTPPPENIKFSDVFEKVGRCRKETLAWNGLCLMNFNR